MKNLAIHTAINTKASQLKMIGQVTPELIRFNAMVIRNSKK
jgi:hypothetical protein